MNYAPHRSEGSILGVILHSWRNHPLQHLFGFLVMIALFAVLLLLCKKAALTCGFLGLVTCIFSYINYMKVTLNGDHFFPRDFSMVGSTGELVKFISGDLPVWFYLGVIATILWIAVLAIMKTQISLRWYIRIPSALVFALCVVLLFSNTSSSAKILNKFDLYFENSMLQQSNYKANGFVSAFMLNLFSMNMEEPENYSEVTITSLLDGYTYTEGIGPKYDVIVVLSESFFDVRNLSGVTFSENPLKNYDRTLSGNNCFSGNIVTTAYGGGTARPEFNILTGLTTDYLPPVAQTLMNMSHRKPSLQSPFIGRKATGLWLYIFMTKLSIPATLPIPFWVLRSFTAWRTRYRWRKWSINAAMR